MTGRREVRVELGERAYDVVIGSGLLADAGALIQARCPTKRAILISDATVAKLHGPAVLRSLAAAGLGNQSLVLPTGEASKNFSELASLLERLLDLEPDRGTVLIALGGGVIGDLVGLAASLLLRGVRFVQIPTTLLAQVDSSVGGKTGVNTRHGKNLIGSFYQPSLVLADIDCLESLPRRELLAGYAEVAKYGLIDDPEFFAWLEAQAPPLIRGDAGLRVRAVEQSVAAKARIVASDERETGARALLNLGHTFAHALEAETGFGTRLLHGEAVAIGMVLAFGLSARIGLCPAGDAERVRAHLAAVGLPVSPRVGGGAISPQALLDRMRQDKKTRDGKLVFILARGIGQAFIARDIAPSAVLDALEAAAMPSA
jgi:3-dehydroquinate synthase